MAAFRPEGYWILTPTPVVIVQQNSKSDSKNKQLKAEITDDEMQESRGAFL
jgi:hypothetical protein